METSNLVPSILGEINNCFKFYKKKKRKKKEKEAVLKRDNELLQIPFKILEFHRALY
jgi:hypothetical protein